MNKILVMAWRNLWRNKRRTIVILVAVFIGVWSMVFLGAFMRGIATGMVRNGISTLTGHLQIHSKGFHEDPSIDHRFHGSARINQELGRMLPKGVLWTQRVRLPAVVANARHSGGVTLVGIDPASEAKVSFIGRAITTGRYLSEGDRHDIVVGKSLLEAFETKIGHKLVVMCQSASGEMASRAFRIVGAYRAELRSTEKQYVFVTKDAAQEMLGIGDDITEISILLPKSKGVSQVRASLLDYFHPGEYEVLTWKELLPLLRAYLQIYEHFILIWYIVVFIAMGFGIVNTTLMAVLERIREFGLLQALGMRPLWVLFEVLVESFVLLILGSIAGNTAAFMCISWFSKRGLDLSRFAAGAEFAGMSRIIFPDLQMRDWALANLVVLVLGIIVSCYPALKAARYTPVEAFAHV